jgi:hypothetical protein
MSGLRLHDLRSMAATALVAAGVDVKTAPTRLGHSSPSLTLGIYARATAAGDRAAAEAVGQFLRGEAGPKRSSTSGSTASYAYDAAAKLIRANESATDGDAVR